MRFQLKNSDSGPLPNGWPTPDGNYYLHLATVGYGMREFVAFVCLRGEDEGSCYIEEVVLISNSNNQQVSANLTRIIDENLKFDLAKWLEDKKLLDIPGRLSEIIDKGYLNENVKIPMGI